LFPRDNSPASFRANLEWRNLRYANLLARRTLLRVYVAPNEVLLLGSSAMGVASPFNGSQGDILVYDAAAVIGLIGQETIQGAPLFSCSALRSSTGNPTLGVITNREQELAGANTIANAATGAVGNGVPGGYTPCYFQPPRPGFYSVVITGPSGFQPDNSRETPPTGELAPLQTDGSQDTSVSAWDVTVRSSLTSTVDLTGRLFTYYLALFTGNNGRPIEATVYTLTTDGFLYQTDLDGLDPNGFVVYGNRTGFLNSDGTPLNRNIVATDDQLSTLLGGVSIARPEFPLFFNPPAPEIISALSIPPPTLPVVDPRSFRFTGDAGDNNTFVSAGGTFAYSASTAHVYELVISRDGSDFDPTNPRNRTLRGNSDVAGAVSVRWNGLDNNGDPFPVGENYRTRVVIRSGEYHFPLLDVENILTGGPRYRLLNPPNGLCPPQFIATCTTAFYDDRGYRTANRTIVGPGVNQPLEPNPPGPDNSDFTVGFNTTSTQRSFTNNFGDKKGLDLWTFYPSAAVFTALNIITATTADLAVQKTVDRPAAGIGENATFSILLTNNGPNRATNVNVIDQLPAGLTFVSATASQGTYDPNTGIWNVGTIAANSSLTLRITATVTVNTPLSNRAELPNDRPQPDPDPENDRDIATLNLPNLRLVKRITAITRAGAAQRFTTFVDDPLDTNDNATGWGQFPLSGVVTLTADQPLESGDEIEYTVYFLSDGSQPVRSVNLCDQAQPLTRILPNSNLLGLGTAAPSPGGEIFSPLAPLPIDNACSNQANPNGSVLFNLGDIPNTPGNNAGFVRFRVRIN
jgi:uncharacterized repeat protein (TIGR01451 family)